MSSTGVVIEASWAPLIAKMVRITLQLVTITAYFAKLLGVDALVMANASQQAPELHMSPPAEWLVKMSSAVPKESMVGTPGGGGLIFCLLENTQSKAKLLVELSRTIINHSF